MRLVLQQVLDRVPGSVGAAVVGLDGIAVEKVTTQDLFNMDLASAEGVNVVKRARSSMGARPGDQPDEIMISSQSGIIILRSLGSDYYLCVVAGVDCIPGQARYETWRAGLMLQETIR